MLDALLPTVQGLVLRSLACLSSLSCCVLHFFHEFMQCLVPFSPLFQDLNLRSLACLSGLLCRALLLYLSVVPLLHSLFIETSLRSRLRVCQDHSAVSCFWGVRFSFEAVMERICVCSRLRVFRSCAALSCLAAVIMCISLPQN